MYWSCSQVVLIRAELFRDSPASAFLTHVRLMSLNPLFLPRSRACTTQSKFYPLGTVLYKAACNQAACKPIYGCIPIPAFYTFPLPPFPDSRPFPQKNRLETPGEGTRRGLCVLIGARKGGVTLGSRSGPSGRGTEERSVNLVKGGRDLHERGRLRQVEAKDGP